MQKQQVGCRVHSGRARPLVRAVQRGEGKSQVQARSSMGAASRLGGEPPKSHSIISRPYFQTDSIADAIIFDRNELSAIVI